VQTFLFFGLRVFEVEHAAAFAAVEDESMFHSSDISVRSYANSRGLSVYLLHKTGGPSRPYQQLPGGSGVLREFFPVVISLALSLALAPSDFCN
jgi:hypothetical protein